ncbi:MAG: hypothetical protein IJL77_04190 [Clostridia bacterium]|nr:hypothetical protein [Clostridia bacterium]
MKKIIAILAALSMLTALAACGAKNDNETATQPVSESETETQPVTEANVTEEASAQEDVTKEEETGEEEPKEEETSEDEKKLPETKAEILAAYAEVMNQAKKDAPGFTKVEYQELPEEGRVITSGKTLVSAGLSVAGNFMTSQDKAEKDPEIQPKGNNMRSWPIRKCPKGCMLEDPEFLKSAKFEVLPDGNYKITLVTKPETNPEPAAEGASTAPSKTGGIITPLSKSEIDENLNGGIVSAVFRDINYKLIYHDCESVLVYNPENNHVISLDQTTRVSISGSAKALGATLAVGNQELINYAHIKDIKY